MFRKNRQQKQQNGNSVWRFLCCYSVSILTSSSSYSHACVSVPASLRVPSLLKFISAIAYIRANITHQCSCYLFSIEIRHRKKAQGTHFDILTILKTHRSTLFDLYLSCFSSLALIQYIYVNDFNEDSVQIPAPRRSANKNDNTTFDDV